MTTQNIYALTDTWNAGGTTFSAIQMNVTNTASASGSLLLDLQVDGTGKFRVAKDGSLPLALSVAGTVKDANGYWIAQQQGFSIYRVGSSFGFGGASNSPDAFITSPAAAKIQLGAADAAAPVAQAFSVQGVVAGTTNTSGADFSIYGSASTGTGNGGSIKLYTSPAGGSGSAQNAGALALTIDSTKLATFAGAVKTLSTVVASLPSASTSGAGARAFVTDATATTFHSTVAGGGANKVSVVSDGTNWLIGG